MLARSAGINRAVTQSTQAVGSAACDYARVPITRFEAGDESWGVGRYLIALRSQNFLAYRLVARVVLALLVLREPETTGAFALIVAGLFADLWTFRLIRRNDTLHLVPRLMLDSTEVALWALFVPAWSADSTALLLVPLTVEVSFRLGLGRGMLLGAYCTMSIWIVGVVFGHPFQPQSVAWIVFAVAGAGGLRSYDRIDSARHARVFAEVRQATERRAYRSGQNSVAMGADSVLDLIHSGVAALGRPKPGTALYALLDHWKADLRERMAGHASYLGDVLSGWQQMNNLRPDLAGHVEFSLSEGDGTILLTARQADQLLSRLSQAELTGTVDVRVVTQEALARPVGSRLDLRVAGTAINLPAASVSMRPLDPGPFVLLLGVAYSLLPARPWAEGVPVRLAIIGAAGSLAAAVWAQRQLNRLGPMARPEIVIVACGLALISIALTTPAVAPLQVNAGHGIMQPFPLTSALYPIAWFAGLYGRSMGKTTAFVAGSTVVLGCALSLWLYPVDVFTLHLGVAVAFLAFTALPGVWFGIGLDRAGRHRAAEVRGRLDGVTKDSFVAGRTFVLEMVTRAGSDARELLRINEAAIESRVAAHVEQRLQEVDRCLQDLRARTPAY